MPARPRLRGFLHLYAFLVSLPLGVGLVLAAPTAKAAAAIAIYAASVSGLLGASALYHRIIWSPARRSQLRRLDHAMISVLIAGSYTPWALLVLDGALAETILVVVWLGALAGIALALFWIDAPKPLTASIYAAIGLPTAASLPELGEKLPSLGVALLLAAGILSALGAAVYALRRPDPVPATFGYHEVYHALTVAALACLSVAVVLYALPADA